MNERRDEEELPRGPPKAAGPNTQPGRIDKTDPDVPTGSGYRPREHEEADVERVQPRVARTAKGDNAVAWTEHRGSKVRAHGRPGAGEVVGDATPEPKEHTGAERGGGRREGKSAQEKGIGAGTPTPPPEKTHPGSGKEPDEIK